MRIIDRAGEMISMGNGSTNGERGLSAFKKSFQFVIPGTDRSDGPLALRICLRVADLFEGLPVLYLIPDQGLMLSRS